MVKLLCTEAISKIENHKIIFALNKICKKYDKTFQFQIFSITIYLFFF